MIIGLHHPAIVVPNLQIAIDFYANALEFKICNRAEWHAPNDVFDQITGLKNSSAKFCLLQSTNCYLELFEFEENTQELQCKAQNANQLGIRHIAFLVDDVHEALNNFLKFGGIKMNDPATVSNVITAVYCRDPFGNIIELRTDIKPLPGF